MGLSVAHPVCAQQPDTLIRETDVTRIETILAADSMQGRRAFTPDIARAARFIQGAFAEIGLDTLAGNDGYRQSFHYAYRRAADVQVRIDGQVVADTDVIVRSTRGAIHWSGTDSLRLIHVKQGADLFAAMRQHLSPDANTVVLIDPAFSALFHQVRQTLAENDLSTESPYSVLFVRYGGPAREFSADITTEIHRLNACNLIGVLPGHSQAGQYVVFSAHYDHLGIAPSPAGEDSIFNGANDDASGTTAVLTLARYFKARGDNARTLVFAAFTGEEEGGRGSRYFASRIDPAQVVAMINIEMIGTPSKWGKNSMYLTGFGKSTLGKILQRNLVGSPYAIHPDPYPSQQLFYRSDNAYLARLGVPAHSLSSSKMDHEPHYHQLSDEVSTLDMANMTALIRAIALAAESVVQGRDTPSRIPADPPKR
jgi:hypothetical protein